MKNKISFKIISLKLLIILLMSSYTISIYPQNCEYQTDTLISFCFNVGYKGKYEPKWGKGYINDIQDAQNLVFNSDTAFMNSFCEIIVLGEDYLSSLDKIINSCFRDSTDDYKRNIVGAMVNKIKIINEKEYDIKLKFKDFDVTLSFSKIIADIHVITYYKRKYMIFTNQTYHLCKEEGVDKIYRIKQIKEILPFTESELEIIYSLNGKWLANNKYFIFQLKRIGLLQDK